MNLNTQQDFVVAILQAFLYALYLVSLAYALRWLLYYEEGWTLRSRDQINWGLLTITVVVFVLTTVNLAFKITGWKLVTFVRGEVTVLQIIIAGISIEGATLVLADATLIFRCWLVYQRSWCAVCFPLVLWLGSIVSLVFWIVNRTMWAFVSEVPYNQRSRFCLQLYYCLNFVTNCYATSAIVYRVWRVARASSTHRQSSILHRICRVVATTGMLYTCTSLPLVVAAFLLKKNAAAYNPCDALNFSMAGITFNLFLIRIGQLRCELSETDVDGSMRNSESILLTTVQLGVSTFATNDTQADANMREK